MLLAVLFDEPFWVALVLVHGDDCTRVHRHVFGAEPTEPEIAVFVRARLRQLLQGPPSAVLPADRTWVLPPTQAGRRRWVREALERPLLTTDLGLALAQMRAAKGAAERATQRALREEEELRRTELHRNRTLARRRGR